MGMQRVEIEIEGTSPLLMNHRPLAEKDNLQNLPAEEQAEEKVYRDPDTKELCIPAECMQRAFVGGAVYSKGKGRASLQRVAAACLLVRPARLLLGTKKYEVDARWVVIKSTKGRVMRYRPRLERWSCRFQLDFNDSLMSEKQAKKIVDDTGLYVGLLDFRPACKGPYGCFMVTRWKLVNGEL